MVLYSCNKDKQERNLKMSEQFNCNAMLSAIKESLNEGDRSLESIQDNTTNTIPWVLGRYQAAKALGKFDDEDNLVALNPVDSISQNGIFGAIGYVRAYELDEFGSIVTNVSDPEEIATIVAYINMEKVLTDISNDLDICWDEELTDKQVEKIKTYIDQQAK
jgi:hypothetical protein